MSFLKSVLGFLTLALITQVFGDNGPNELVCNDPVVARLPPSLSSSTNPQFKDTPRGYFSGLSFLTYSSTLDAVKGIKNVQLLSVYNAPADITSDVTSYQFNSCPHIYTTFETDADNPNQDDNYPLHLPGTNVTVMTDILAYGLDTDCHRYFVSYGTDPSPGLTIYSQIQSGPNAGTVAAIKKALKQLGNSVLTGEVKKIGRLTTDGARSGLPDFICGTECLTNRNTFNGTCLSG